MPSLDHTHIYKKWKKLPSGEQLWKCNHQRCTHFIEEGLIEGKISICNICKQNELLMSKENLRRVEPRCVDCSNTAEGRRKRKLQALIAESLGLDSVVEEKPPSIGVETEGTI